MRTQHLVAIASMLAFMAVGAAAETRQDCILEGTLNKKRSTDAGQAVYVQFHSASQATESANCKLTRGKKLSFTEPKNAMIENVPDGSEVRYHYTEDTDGQTEWRLLSVSIR